MNSAHCVLIDASEILCFNRYPWLSRRGDDDDDVVANDDDDGYDGDDDDDDYDIVGSDGDDDDADVDDGRKAGRTVTQVHVRTDSWCVYCVRSNVRLNPRIEMNNNSN